MVMAKSEKEVKFFINDRRVTRVREEGEVSPALFGKLEKKFLIWRKNALIVVISR